MLGYRLISGDSLLINRSFCPHCKKVIAWYDNIPVISWFFLRGKCRSCSVAISWLYPFIEVITALIFVLMSLLIPSCYWFAYCIFFSALIVTIRTDIHSMLISPLVTIGLIPFAMILSYLGLLPITFGQSVIGAATAYLFLMGFDKLFYLVTHKQGIGLGDIELLAFIGAFVGTQGWLISLLVGSFLGTLFGLTQSVRLGSYTTKIPFGPFLALGAFVFVFMQAFNIDFFYYSQY